MVLLVAWIQLVGDKVQEQEPVKKVNELLFPKIPGFLEKLSDC
jgi:hypothetical protein